MPGAAGSPHPHTPAGLSARGRYDHKLDVFSFGLLLWEWFARELVHREIEVIDRSIARPLYGVATAAVMLRCNNGFPRSCLRGSHAYGERVHRCRHGNVGPPARRIPRRYPYGSAVRQRCSRALSG